MVFVTNNTSTIRTKEYKKKYEDIFPISDYIYEEFQKQNLLKKYHAELEFIYIKGILRSNVILFAHYKEGLKNIPKLRKNVLSKFSDLKHNTYLKQESFKNRLVTWITLKFPSQLIYWLKKIK